MSPLEKSKHLKEAVFGYVSKAWHRMLSMRVFQMLQKRLKSQIDARMADYATSFKNMSEEDREWLKLLSSNDYDVSGLFPLNLISLEERIQDVFDRFGIDVSFLEDFNMSLIDFAHFTIELAERVKKRREKEDDLSDADIIQKEAKKLVLTRYTAISVEIVPYIVERYNSIELLFQVSICLRTVLQLDVVPVSAKEPVSFEYENGVRRLVVDDEKHRIMPPRSKG